MRVLYVTATGGNLLSRDWADYIDRLSLHIDTFARWLRVDADSPTRVVVTGAWTISAMRGAQEAIWEISLPEHIEPGRLDGFREALAACAARFDQPSVTFTEGEQQTIPAQGATDATSPVH